MRTAQGSQIDTQPVSGASVDMHTTRKRPLGDRSWGWASIGTIDTDVQVLPHEGFKTGVVHTRDTRNPALDTDGAPQLAKPPGWTETTLPCVPPPSITDKVERRQYMDRWDVNERRIRNAPAVAEELCAGCPVRMACLSAALEEERGVSAQHVSLVRGGMTPRQRVALTVS